jgi:hypothetical protein
MVHVIIQVQIPASVLCTSRIQKLFVVMSFSLSVCVCMFYCQDAQEFKSKLYLSQLKISDASIIFPTWVFSRLSFTIMNFPLPTCWICARNTWLECSTIHHARTSSLCPCLLLNKMLRPWTLDRAWVLYYNNFSLVVYLISGGNRKRFWPCSDDCLHAKKRLVGSRDFEREAF